MHPPAELDQLAALARHQAAFASTLADADLDAPVPWCGRWRVRSLAVHLARVHHWAAAQARRTREVPLGRGPFDVVELYDRCAAEVLGTLTSLDPHARAWTLADDGVPAAEQCGTVAFWHRRQALETLVHLWDLRTALGEELTGAEARAVDWSDCVAEVVQVVHPRQVRLGRVGPPALRVRLAADGAAPLEVAGAPVSGPVTTVAGPARALALLVWGRTGLDDPEIAVDGDVGALTGLLAAGLTP